MPNAEQLLFSAMFKGKHLFKNQLDLVNQLLHTPGSAYFIAADLTKEDEGRAQGRLKTYVSQLLSETIFRNVTEDFKTSLGLVLETKLPPDIKKDVLNGILEGLQEKNNALNRRQDIAHHAGSKISLKEDIKTAEYVVVVTARPIDMNLPIKESEFNVRNWFYDDLVKSVLGSTDKMKFYRFNFPTNTYCDLFWQGLEKLMVKYLYNLTEQPEYVRFLYHDNFTLTTETLHDYEAFMQERALLSNDQAAIQKLILMQRIASEVIERLNRNKFISLFYIGQPIFSIPIIAINPSESNCKVYGILDSEDDQNLVYKFSQENTVLWRIFFWDKVKAFEMGEPAIYKRNTKINSMNSPA
jgi:hypothetical protein